MVKWKIDPMLFLYGAVLLLFLPLPWVLSAIAAAGFHEMCHIWAIRWCGGTIHAGQIGWQGAVLKTAPMEKRQELICAMAGPVGSLLLVLTYRWLPTLALCGLVQGCFNLLPIFPLDGGRALRCLTQRLSRRSGCRIEGICLLVLFLLSIWISVRCALGFWLPLGFLILAGNALLRKNSLQSCA